MTRLEERIRSGLQETAERIPDTAPTLAADRVRFRRPTGVWAAVAAVVAVLVLFTPILFLGGSDPDTPPTGGPSPNGWVAFDSRAGDIYLVRPGEDAFRLEVAGSDTADDACPTWSPDGTRLLFGRTGSSDITSSELVIVPVGRDGAAGSPTVIALDGFDDHPCAIWAPDGRWVAFAGTGEVWVVDTQTGAIRRLPDLRPIDLEWRPGTDQLAIAGDLGPTRASDWVSTPVTVYSVSTGELHQLGSIEAGTLTWSPDGSTLAYWSAEDQDELWLVDADGTNERLLLADTGSANHGIGPVWSPTGDRIVYQRLIGSGERHEVVLVSVADGNHAVIEPPQTNGPGGPVTWFPWTVTWSPDGTTLLYTAWSNAPGPTEQQGLIAVPADTPSDLVILIDTLHVEHHQLVLIQNWGRHPE